MLVKRVSSASSLWLRVARLNRINVSRSLVNSNLNGLAYAPNNSKLSLRQFTVNVVARKVVPFNLADIGEGITECELIQWFVKEGDEIQQFDRICEVQSDKASVEITSRFDGKITKLHYAAGDMANVGQPLIDIDTGDGSGSVETKVESKPTPATPSSSDKPVEKVKSDADIDRHLTFATPAVRRIAKENSVNLSQVVGTGKAGRVLKEDILNFVNGTTPAVAQAHSVPPTTTSIPTAVLGDEIRPLNVIQKVMFKTMTQSLTIPHFGYADELVVDDIMALRAQINANLASQPNPPVAKISFLPILIKALSLALHEFPLLNAKLELDGPTPQLRFRPHHNIGVAMDTPNGLLVPNIKHCETKSILDIAIELKRIQEAGKLNAIKAEDLKEGTVTLSNIGTIGGTYLNPVITSNQLAIGALGKLQRLPRFKDNKSMEVVPTHVIPVSWSADHRVVDGATMARFSERWRQLLENPISMIANLR